MTNYYKILGLPTYASIAEVKEAYKAKIKQYHPDISNAPDAEEMTKYLNLAKGNLDTIEAKERYDRRLKLAYLQEIQKLTKNAAPQRKKTTVNVQERIRRSKEARKWRVKQRYEKNLEYFPKKFRLPGCILLIMWGLQLMYSHYFFYYGSMDRTLVIVGIGIFFMGASFGASEMYTNYVIQSIRQRVPHNFEQKIGISLVLGFVLGIGLVISINEYRAYYHLMHNYAYTTATIDYNASLNGLTVVRYEVDDKVYYKKLDVDLKTIHRLTSKKTAIRYAVVNPLIVSSVTAEEVRYLPVEF